MNITLEHGDALEQANIQWIRETIPEYEMIWSRFIGHDGTGKPCSLEVCSPISQSDRERFYQAHYTMLYALVILRDECQKYQKTCGYVSDLAGFLSANKDLHCFMAHVGKIRDMFIKMAGAISAPHESASRFSDFYAQRNAVLHGSNMPFAVEEGCIMIPLPAEKLADGATWTDESKWSSAEVFEYAFVTDFMRDTLTELISMIRGSLSLFLSRLQEIHTDGLPPFKIILGSETRVVDHIFLTAGSSTLRVPISGTKTC